MRSAGETARYEQAVMACNPFLGDKDGGAELHDKMVTARVENECHCCGGTIKPGDRIRSRKERDYGELVTFRWCPDCCAAMALEDEDMGAAFEARIDLHR